MESGHSIKQLPLHGQWLFILQKPQEEGPVIFTKTQYIISMDTLQMKK